MARQAGKNYSRRGLVKQWVFCQISDERLNKALNNPFSEFAILQRNNELGAEAYQLWREHGERLLKEAKYEGSPKKWGNVFSYVAALPPRYRNLGMCLSYFGEPWKKDG